MVKIKRKVIQIADSTQLVSLPRKWGKLHNIKKGDELEVVEQGNTIVISTEKEVEFERIKVDISKFNKRTITWVLAALYKSGYDEVEFTFDKPELVPIIQTRVKELLGFAIIEQSDKRCIIKCISRGMESEFNSTLRRAFLVTISMADSVFDLVKKKEYSNLLDLIQLEETNTQLTDFCHRILNRKGYENFRKTTYIYVIIWNLESIADDYKSICQLLSKLSEQDKKQLKISSEMFDLFERVNELLKTFYELFYQYDDAKVVKIANEKKELFLIFNKLLLTTHKHDTLLADHLFTITQRVTDCMGSYFGLNY